MCAALNGSLQVGDEVKQEIRTSLSLLVGRHYVASIDGEEITLSQERGGKPLADSKGKPRRFLASNFLLLPPASAAA